MYNQHVFTSAEGRLLYRSTEGAVVIYDPSNDTTEELVSAYIMVNC